MCRRGVLIVGISQSCGNVDIPSWKGRRGRLATAKECRRKTLDAVSVGRERILVGGGGVAPSSHNPPITCQQLNCTVCTHVGSPCGGEQKRSLRPPPTF